MRNLKNRDSKVNPNKFDGLALGFVVGDRDGQTHGELMTFSWKEKFASSSVGEGVMRGMNSAFPW